MRLRPGQGKPQQLRAIIWVPEEDRDRLVAQCLAYCERRGYEVVALVVGGEEKWQEIRRAATEGAADVCVVPSKEPIRDRLPRMEAVTEELPRIPAQRRTGRVQRWTLGERG